MLVLALVESVSPALWSPQQRIEMLELKTWNLEEDGDSPAIRVAIVLLSFSFFFFLFLFYN